MICGHVGLRFGDGAEGRADGASEYDDNKKHVQLRPEKTRKSSVVESLHLFILGRAIKPWQLKAVALKLVKSALILAIYRPDQMNYKERRSATVDSACQLSLSPAPRL
jgi:hypothetical protein